MKKIIVPLIFTLFLISVFSPLTGIAADKPLEVSYPSISGINPSEGLPQYIKYIFRFSILIIGLIIFGALIYNGFQYVSSVGNPGKLTDARNGIISAFLGAIILLSAYLIFNAINPQLTVLKPLDLTSLATPVYPGIYLCKNGIENIGSTIGKYKSEDVNDSNKAAQELKKIIKDKCFLLKHSRDLPYTFKKNYTVFAIPIKEKNNWAYNEAVVFHEKTSFAGKCEIWPNPQNGKIYTQPKNFTKSENFSAKSITLIKKLSQTTEETTEGGVTLFSGLAYNAIGEEKGKILEKDKEEKIKKQEEENKKLDIGLFTNIAKAAANTSSKLFSILNDVGIFNDLGPLNHNTRSLKIEPKNKYMAVLIGKGEEKCEIRENDDANLTDDPIGKCGTCNIIKKFWGYITFSGTDCYPCLEKLEVIKGQKI